MERLNRRLPPPRSLLAFEAAARLRNFTRAAVELGVTQAAVSRHIQALERHLNCRLFERSSRSVRLTDRGAILARTVGRGLEAIAETAEEIRRADTEVTVTILANVAVSTLWLGPRLHRFSTAHPEIDVHLVAADGDWDLELTGFDLAILYGSGDWPELEVRRLFSEVLFPVVGPDWLSAHAQPDDVAALTRLRLLHVDQVAPEWINWPAWIRHFGVQVPDRLAGPKFNSYPILLDAAEAGMGVAMGSRDLIGPRLAAGRLVRLGQEEMVSPKAYWLCRAAELPPAAPARQLWTWLTETG